MRKYSLVALFGVASVACLSLAIPAAAEDPSYMDVNAMIPSLGKPQSDEDRGLDKSILKELGDTSPESLRLIGDDEIATYWVGRQGNTKVCLFVQTAETTASSCATFSDFYRSGLSMAAGESLDKPETLAEAYLVPADVDAGKIVADTKSRNVTFSSKIVNQKNNSFISVIPNTHANLKNQKVVRNSGIPFQFTPLVLDGGR